MFGAVGDGVTNDTAVLQDAFSAALTPGATLLIPSGSYLVTEGQLTITATVNVYGGPVINTAPKVKFYAAGLAKAPILTITNTEGVYFHGGYLGEISFFDTNTRSAPITGISKANPAVVTYSGANIFANGDTVRITGAVGMTEVNNLDFTVAGLNTGAKTFQLSGIDSTGYGVWSSGGTAALNMIHGLSLTGAVGWQFMGLYGNGLFGDVLRFPVPSNPANPDGFQVSGCTFAYVQGESCVGVTLNDAENGPMFNGCTVNFLYGNSTRALYGGGVSTSYGQISCGSCKGWAIEMVHTDVSIKGPSIMHAEIDSSEYGISVDGVRNINWPDIRLKYKFGDATYPYITAGEVWPKNGILFGSGIRTSGYGRIGVEISIEDPDIPTIASCLPLIDFSSNAAIINLTVDVKATVRAGLTLTDAQVFANPPADVDTVQVYRDGHQIWGWNKIVQVTLQADTATHWTMAANQIGQMVWAAGTAARMGVITWESIGTSSIANLSPATGGESAVTTGVLTGTTGTAGKITFSINNNDLYAENRLGGAISLFVDIERFGPLAVTA
jgi:hypothetical protein